MASPRELHVGEPVRGAGGRRLGEIERIVVDERAHRVTHLVVAGRLVGSGRFREARDLGLELELDEDDLERLPAADLDAVTSPGPHWLAPAGRALGDFLAIAGALVGQVPYTPPVQAELGALDDHRITAGSPAWFGSDRLGEIEELRLDEAGHVSGLLLRRSGPTGYQVLVPVERVVEVVGNNVHLDLSAGELDLLPEA